MLPKTPWTNMSHNPWPLVIAHSKQNALFDEVTCDVLHIQTATCDT